MSIYKKSNIFDVATNKELHIELHGVWRRTEPVEYALFVSDKLTHRTPDYAEAMNAFENAVNTAAKEIPA